ncbi:MAG TPA: alpha/beta fold hydrolase [Candidatus Hydrogenedentes bacterium]|nr:alpha/beta fold hydrolase [Candidatus Hydrogenedentota bacterium]
MTNIRTSFIHSVSRALIQPLLDRLHDASWHTRDVLHEVAYRWQRRATRQALWKALLEEFETDYARAYTPGQTRPPDVGRPFLLMPRIPARAGIVLIHGYMAAPLEMRALGEFLQRGGFAVLGIRLKGHGTSPEDLASRHYEEWYASVLRGIELMEQVTRRVGVCGFSAGGDLALLAAARLGTRIRATAAICAPLRLKNRAAALAPSIVRVNAFMRRIGLNRFQWDYVDNHPENPHINYTRNPLTGVGTLRGLMQETEDALSRVEGSILILQASGDPVVHPESAAEIFERAATRHKTLVMLSRDRHGIVNGEGARAVFDTVYRYFAETLWDRRPGAVEPARPDLPASTVPVVDASGEPDPVLLENPSSSS